MRGHSFVLPATLGSSSLKRNQISFPQLVGTSGPHLSRCQCYYKVSGNLHWGHPWASATFFWAQMPGSQTCFRANLKRREAPGAWGPQPLCFSISFGDPQTKEETPLPFQTFSKRPPSSGSFTFPRTGFTFPRLKHKVVSLTPTQGPHSKTLLSQASNLRRRVGAP